MLDVVPKEHLGFAANGRDSKKDPNSRNGKGSKKVRGDFGELEIDIPRESKGTLEPQRIKTRQQSVGNFAD